MDGEHQEQGSVFTEMRIIRLQELVDQMSKRIMALESEITVLRATLALPKEKSNSDDSRWISTTDSTRIQRPYDCSSNELIVHRDIYSGSITY